ncbi:FMN-linked oxidoreductase [Dichomitus squalens]|uniref:FMN-linked oxidoreductase n=1 Tax=Dichomitus squalens TaxID=114155 RepID=A0A4Q9MAV0_9APHY|nr:FMN-linked oxidoreductase [Dichomitus squalens]
MYEHFAPLWGSGPHEGFIALYQKWAAGGWGMIMTGNIQVAKDHLPLGRDLVVPDALSEETLAPWRELANTIHFGAPAASSSRIGLGGKDEDSRPLAIMQLSHGGRQSLNFYGGRRLFAPPLAPSPIRVGQMHKGQDGWLSRLAHWLFLQVPKEMTHEDIQRTIGQFALGAQLAAQSGFDGIELHAAHGYLISEFISPKTNRRTDEYSADRDPLRFLREIVEAIRAPSVVPDDFIVGVKLNAADYARDTCELQENRALQHVREIGKWGLVDTIQVSGGDYEDPQFIDVTLEYKSARQVVYESFAQRSIDILSSCTPTVTFRPPPLVLLTGGLNTLPRMSSALARDHAQLLGIGRLSVIHPHLPTELSAALSRKDADFLRSEPWALSELGDPPSSYLSWRGLERALWYVCLLVWSYIPAKMPRVVGATANVNWYNYMMRRHALGQDLDFTVGTVGTMARFFLLPVPHPSRTDGEGDWVWWLSVAVVGVVLGMALGQVI